MSLHWRRVRAISRKELREYRRRRSILIAIAIFPLVFLLQPLVVALVAPASSAATLAGEHLLLYMLAIPVLTPAVLGAYAVAGERQQGTLEPVLTTPVRREEFLLGKALAVLAPSIAIAYAVYVAFVVTVALFAQPAVAAGLIKVPDIAAQVVFTPLLAAFSNWVAIAVSTRSTDVRVAQQVALLAILPLVLLTSLIAFGVIAVSPTLAVVVAVVLAIADVSGWRIVAPLFDRERLVTAVG